MRQILVILPKKEAVSVPKLEMALKLPLQNMRALNRPPCLTARQQDSRMNGQKSFAKGIRVGSLAKGRVKPETRQGYILLCMALWSTIACLLVHQFVLTTVLVQGKSMMPTLKPGDCYFVNCLLPHVRDYKRGDIVVIRDPVRNEFIVKRIVGLPTDEVQVRGGRVYLNGQILPEPYLDLGTQTYPGRLRNRAITIGEHSYFVMGDNRGESDDSRYFGNVDRRDLVGIISR